MWPRNKVAAVTAKLLGESFEAGARFRMKDVPNQTGTIISPALPKYSRHQLMLVVKFDGSKHHLLRTQDSMELI